VSGAATPRNSHSGSHPCAHLVDQEPVGAQAPPDLLVVAGEDVDSVRAVLEPVGERPDEDELVHHRPGLAQLGRELALGREQGRPCPRSVNAIDRRRDALIPALGIADREHHPGIGIRLRELSVERARRPVHGGPVAGEQRVPVDTLATDGRAPESNALGVVEELNRVVAGAPAELLERHLERHRAGASQSRADNLHAANPTRSLAALSTPRDAASGAGSESSFGWVPIPRRERGASGSAGACAETMRVG
jgi:hypothetical protein